MPSVTNDATTLVIFTNRFPYGKGEHFLTAELNYLIQYFDRIILIPAQTDSQIRPIPKGVAVELNYASTRPRGRKHYLLGILLSIQSRHLYTELAAHLMLLIHPKALKKLLGFLANGLWVRRWMFQFITSRRIDVEKTIFYTYWLDSHTFGLGLLKASYPHLTLVSRTHGGDLYAERYRPAYIPIRQHTLNRLDALFTISEHGRQYIIQRYPQLEHRVNIARLGVGDPQFDTVESTDSVLRVVSCAFMVPVKRLSLLIDALGTYSRRHPNCQIEWHHFGDGSLWDVLQAQAEQSLPENVSWYFPGYLLPSEIMSHYQTHPVDAFLSVSESEGIPVSIMEAYSCGIPAIATAVGGVPEIVNNTNGILLSETPSVEDIVDALCQIYESHGREKRERSKQTWHRAYRAETNFRTFADMLIQLIPSKAT